MNSDQNAVVNDPFLNQQKRRETAWRLYHERDWTLDRIGARLGVSRSGVSKLLRREAIRSQFRPENAKLPRRIKRTRIHPVSLSYTFNV